MAKATGVRLVLGAERLHLMRVTWIIEALGALASRLWLGAKRLTSPLGRPTATGPLSGSSDAATDEAGTDPEQSTAADIPDRNLRHDDGTHQERTDSGDTDDQNGPTESGDSTSEPPSDFGPPKQVSPGSSSDSADQTPSASTEVDSEGPVATAPLLDDDQQDSLLETVGHSERDEPERVDYGTEKAPKSDRKPREIGGRRGRQQSSRQTEQQLRSPLARPELICRKAPGSTTWEIILTADAECRLAVVHLEGKRLDHTAPACRVPSVTGRLTVSCQDGQEHDYPLFEEDPLIFKLRKNWLGDGRKIARITSGHFIVIAPTSWERTGRAPVEPDGCADTAFRAHYFHREANATDESLDGFREWSNSPVATCIELTGRCVFDDSDEGDLFVGDAPSLQSSPEIVWARVGEETEHGWGQSFLPDAQSLPEVLGGREGRFFLRVYDSEARLLDSTAFRCVRNLLRIRVNGTDYSQDLVVVPTSSGHSPTEVRFVGADGSTIAPILPTEALQAAAPSGALVVPPNPDADHISCTLATDASGVVIVLDLPRIWWRLEHGRPGPGEWRDTPIIMTRQEFREHAHSNVSMALLSRRFGSVRAGFDDEPAQPYRRLIEDDQIAIPLAHFVDHEQIDRRLNEDAHFNVEWAKEIVPLIVISADPVPEILSFTAEPATILAGEETLLEWTTRNAGDARLSIDPDAGEVDSDGTIVVRPTETTRYTLTLAVPSIDGIISTTTVAVEQLPVPGKRPTARVMSAGGGWRSGKGFSLRELQDASVTVTEAVARSIPIDRRRRTSHRANVERVRGMLDG